MKHDPILRTKRRATNVTLPEGLVDQARELGVSLSKACETGLSLAVKEAADQRWKRETADWVEAHRRWVETHELPLERYRLF